MRVAARAYPPALRWACAGLLAVAGGILPLLLYRVLAVTDPPATTGMLLRALLAFAAVPWLAAWFLRRALAADVVLGQGELVVRVGGEALRVPLARVAAVEPWRLPLPEPGFSLRLASGERLRLGIGLRDPSTLLDALAAAGVEPASAVRGHLTLVYARARAAIGAWRWYHLAVKYPLFALFPAGVLFRAYQLIAYGGLLGQYELEGAAAYVRTAALYWVTATVYLVLYGSGWRVQIELASLLGALAATRAGEPVALRTRRLAESVGRLAFYAGVPLLLALRFAS